MLTLPTRTLLGLGCILFAGGLGAPGFAAPQDPVPAAAPQPDFQAEYQALMKEFEAAQQTFFAKFETLTTDEERMALFGDETQNPNLTFAPRFRAFAWRAGTNPAAGEAWNFLLSVSSDQEEAKRIAELLMKDFLNAPAAEKFAQWLRYGFWQLGREEGIKHLRALDASKHVPARAAACFSLAAILMGGEAEEQKEARALFGRLQKEFAATTYAKQADGYLYELDHLQVGMVAPEIEGTDSEGKAFKLSDYRGKVVVLDYWGFW
jgi:hypothetical protein